MIPMKIKYSVFFLSLCLLLINTSFTNAQSNKEENTKETIVQIQKGMTLKEVALLLKQSEIINSVFYFQVLAWITNQSENIKYGEYSFKPEVSTYAVLQTVVTGQTRLQRITFPEGYNLFEIANLLEEREFCSKDEFIALVRDPNWISQLLNGTFSSLEGYLFPDTYFFPKETTAQSVSEAMVQRFLAVYSRLQNEGASPPVSLTRHEIVTLASIVEKETGVPQERARIASVFYNRLNQSMRLQSDPTILYGMLLEADGVPSTNIRKQDIRRPTPYNTYQINGFPPGPIGNPGEAALRAVFQPENTEYFYFVSRGDKTHVFSITLEQHERMVDKYQRRRHKRKNTP